MGKGGLVWRRTHLRREGGGEMLGRTEGNSKESNLEV